LPGSLNIAGGGEIELAYHRIHQPAGELNWSQHVELLPVTNQADTWQMSFTCLTRILKSHATKKRLEFCCK